MEAVYLAVGFATCALAMSVFSNKQGSTTLILSIVMMMGIAVGLYMNPNVETFMMIVFVVSMFFFVSNRYWRNVEGLRVKNKLMPI